MKLFDSHCHLDDKGYKRDFKSVLKRAHAAGVKCMLTVGASHKGSSRAVSIAESNPGVYASVGVHPHYARDRKSVGLLQGDIVRSNFRTFRLVLET